MTAITGGCRTYVMSKSLMTEATVS
jgi:hypothetical protein